MDEWLPERHLARFVVEMVEQLDLSTMVKAYRASGSASYHPSVLLGLKLQAREEKARQTGRKPGGKPPAPPVAGPGPKDQVNLTDPDSRIMPVSGVGFEQSYNVQAAVAAGSMLVVARDVVQAAMTSSRSS